MNKKFFSLVFILFLSHVSLSHSQEMYATYNEELATFTFYYDDNRNSREGSSYPVEYVLVEGNPFEELSWFVGGGFFRYKVKTVVFDSSFKDARPRKTSAWFSGFDELVSIVGIENLNTSEVTDMKAMFSGCWKLKNLDLSNFDTSKVTAMSSMFDSCTSLTSLDLTNFDTSNVEWMDHMFYKCTQLESLNISSFDTRNVWTMEEMFSYCFRLSSIDVTNFDVQNVTSMSRMFYFCGITSIDVSSFELNPLVDNYQMFGYTTKLKTIYSKKDWSDICGSGWLFSYCYELVGGAGFSYKENEIYARDSGIFARIDTPENPGYFTLKTEHIGINSIIRETGSTEDVFFDTQGRKHSKGARGIRMKDGRKYIIK